MAELLVRNGQRPRYADQFVILELFQYIIFAVGEWVYLVDTAKEHLDDKWVDKVEGKVLDADTLLEGHDIGHLSGHHCLSAFTASYGHVVTLAHHTAVVLIRRSQNASGPVSVAKQVDDSIPVIHTL